MWVGGGNLSLIQKPTTGVAHILGQTSEKNLLVIMMYREMM